MRTCPRRRRRRRRRRKPPAVGYVLAVVPILGGASLFLGGAVAIALDRARLVRAERQRAQKLGRQPHLVLIRYLSAVIGDPKGWPHRVFLVCVTVYALCLIATGCLQAHILETRVPGSATWQLIVYPIAGGVCGVVMANFTNGHAACTKNSRKAIIFHCVFASGFIGFSVSYGGSTVSLATALAESAALQAARTACAITCGVGCFWNIMLAGAAAYGSIKLGQHEAAEDEAIEAAAAGGAATSGDGWNRTVASTGLRADPRKSRVRGAVAAAHAGADPQDPVRRDDARRRPMHRRHRRRRADGDGRGGDAAVVTTATADEVRACVRGLYCMATTAACVCSILVTNPGLV